MNNEESDKLDEIGKTFTDIFNSMIEIVKTIPSDPIESLIWDFYTTTLDKRKELETNANLSSSELKEIIYSLVNKAEQCWNLVEPMKKRKELIKRKEQ